MSKTQITVKLVPTAALELRQRGPTSVALRELLDEVDAHGLTLEPMHSGTADHELGTYFVIRVGDPETAGRLLAQIQRSDSIEAAYIKPRDEAPQF